MRTREMFGKYHRSVLELSRAAKPDSNWEAALKDVLGEFEAEAEYLSATSIDELREGLCAQLEQEALVASSTLPRQVLHAAVKWLEMDGR